MPRIYGQDWTRAALARQLGDTSQVYGIRLATLADGVERGVRVLEVRAGNGLAFDILVDRCMDIGSLCYRGAAVGFHSPTGFRSPWLHEADAEGGLGFLRSFSGLVNTCGLDHVMGPEVGSAAHYNYPYRDTIAHGLHGRASYIPARLEGYGERWDGDRCVLWAEGVVRQVAMFGENLELRRRIEVEVGGLAIRIADRVENRGFHLTPHMMLYHVNVAWPVLAEGSRLHVPIATTPWTSHDPAATKVGPLDQPGPQRLFREQVYEHALTPDADGRVAVALANAGFSWGDDRRGLGFLLEYSAHQLPAFYQWQNLQEGHYVMGLEPATVHAGTRADRVARGEARWLEHGQACAYDLVLSVLPDADAIAAVAARIGRLAAPAG